MIKVFPFLIFQHFVTLLVSHVNYINLYLGSSVVECLTRDQGDADSSLTSITQLCPCAGHINSCLVVLVQPRKTHLHISGKFLTGTVGRKESNQTNISIPGLLMYMCTGFLVDSDCKYSNCATTTLDISSLTCYKEKQY